MEGWIKLHRKFLEWEWFKVDEMVKLFIYLLLSANYEDKKWQGVTIKRGQLLTGINSLHENTKISRQSLRTCLSRLEKTGEINKQSTNKYTIITICNYDSYQDFEITTNNQTNKQLTNNQKTINKQLTTTKEIKEYKELNISFDVFWNLYEKKVGDKTKLTDKWNKLKDEERKAAIEHIPKYKLSQPDKKYRKDPATYLNNKSWNDEIIDSQSKPKLIDKNLKITW